MIRASVVMPVGSVDPELGEQFRALAGQDTDLPWELVVSLNTPEAAARAALDDALTPIADAGVPVTVVDSSAVRSASHARNAGAAAAKAEWLLFCDGDDIAEPDWIRCMTHALAEHRAVGGHLAEERLSVPGQENWRPPATPGDNPSFLGHPYLVSANLGVHADDFRAAGGFDESLVRGEDIAFSWALTRLGIDLAFAPDAVIHYRHRKGLWPMLRQHYLYGRGMSQLLARSGTPDGGGATLRPNGQRVERSGAVHVARRGAIAIGRVVGLVQEKIRPASPDRSPA